jgi:hypothetical protein
LKEQLAARCLLHHVTIPRMEVFAAWLKDKVADQIKLPAKIHRNGTHYTALVQVSGRLGSPNSSLSQVVGLFMACQGRAGTFFIDDRGTIRQCHFSADKIDPAPASDGNQEVTLEFDIEN